jgi:hypothetical protein
MKRILSLGVIALFAAAAAVAVQDKTEFRTIDGIPHAINPAKPLKGTIALEVERTRTINPYDQSEVGLRMTLFSRDAAGNVMLFDPNNAEGHRFDASGKYLGLVTKKGQGPGEFSPMQGYRTLFQDPGIWVFGGMKVAHFDASGALLKERILKNRISAGVDASHFFTYAVRWDAQKKSTRTLKLVAFDMEAAESTVDLLSAENIGTITNPNGQGGISEGWATPNFFYTADPERSRIYCGLKQEYKVRVKDFAGKDLLVVERLGERAKIGRKDIDVLFPEAAKEERLKWIYSAFPDRFLAIKDIHPMPKGFLGVFRITGPEKMELDVFDPEGRYLYAVKLPEKPRSYQLEFFASGYAVIEYEMADGYAVYREYRIKNLPEIFGK